MITKIKWENVPVEQVTPMMQRQIVHGEKVMIAKMKFKNGFRVPLHSHENEQVTEVQKGTIRFWFGKNKEQQLDIHEGETVVIPGNLPHEALMIGNVEETDTWAPPRKDWLDGTDDYLKK
ncbi:cupin domain-containing protein [Tenacibaculum xiamenense]|uniref:cupin domain-containing protein n=1 Tax=Tenacibaculum xiamenense TaxID=1261553 RepID=UPI003894513F